MDSMGKQPKSDRFNALKDKWRDVLKGIWPCRKEELRGTNWAPLHTADKWGGLC